MLDQKHQDQKTKKIRETTTKIDLSQTLLVGMKKTVVFFKAELRVVLYGPIILEECVRPIGEKTDKKKTTPTNRLLGNVK